MGFLLLHALHKDTVVQEVLPGEAQARANGMLQDAVHVAASLPPFGWALTWLQ